MAIENPSSSHPDKNQTQGYKVGRQMVHTPQCIALPSRGMVAILLVESKDLTYVLTPVNLQWEQKRLVCFSTTATQPEVHVCLGVRGRQFRST
ncbi:hypothetical protein CEXT_742861 [Caerostris extrusa]|uniref:Uncharacterized protein n=1 Tax=Caerostris extrusa TaxID=172846 RepID=A0AAV4WBM5_CAEEX|nr:hypothetical protein CEXT_742861 [Caerostris extrusa]